MIENVMKPVIDKNDENDVQDEPNNPFDVFEGRPFNLIITRTNTFQVPDQSKFLNKLAPIIVDGEKITEKTPDNLKKIKQFIIDNAPDILQCEFRPWDETTKKFVYGVIKSTIPRGELYDLILDKNKVFFSELKEDAKPVKKVDALNPSKYDEPDEEEVEPEIDDEDEEEKPVKRTIKLKIKEEPDEEDEESEDEEDEDNEVESVIKKIEQSKEKTSTKKSAKKMDTSFLDE